LWASANLADVADREAATLLNKPCGRRLHGFYFAAQRTGKRRELEGSAMSEEGKSWLARLALVGRSHVATQAAVLLPVLVLAGLAAWTMFSAPTNAKGQSAQDSSVAATAQLAEVQPAASEGTSSASQGVAPVGQAAAAEPLPVDLNGLKISWQSWRRGGLGSNALITFTLHNANDYAVKDVEIDCAFSRRDGSHLTDRKRVIPDAVVSMKSRKTFAHMHIGYVNINANKAKCTPVAASRV
jgi:hypothetical protein